MFLNVSLLVGGFFRYSLNNLLLDCFIEFESDWQNVGKVVLNSLAIKVLSFAICSLILK